MRVIQQQVFKYSELSEGAQEKAREWYRRDWDSDWSEGIIEDARAAGSVMGWTIDNVYWSGFSSQGDGACFTGKWFASDVQPVEKLGIYDDELIRIATEMQSFAVAMKLGGVWIDRAMVSHSARYSHSHSVSFDCSWTSGANADADADEPFLEAVVSEEERFTELSRDFMDWIYRALEAEYEYQTSDELVAENIEANGYEFTEEGEIA